jgi:hypothetical protein
MFISILIWCLFFGFICSYIAKEKGRDAGGWFFGGFLLGIFGVIVLACIPSKK